MTTQPVNQFTLDIIQSSFKAISTEMFYTMQKTSISPIIYEILDMGIAISSAEGDLLSSGAGIPAFIGMLDAGICKTIEKFGHSVKEGDIFITNDPYNGGVTHLNDVVLCMPIFYKGNLIAWVSNIAHYPDIGGMVPGGISTDATEIFQEGIIIPCVLGFENDKPIPSILDIMKSNSRMPKNVEADLWAGAAACFVGRKNLLEMIEKYGSETFLVSCKELLDHGERVSLAGLKKLPKTKLELTENMDDGTPLNVKIEIKDDEFIVDLRDNPKQFPSPVNVSRDGVIVACEMIFKSVTSPYTESNGGTYRPLTVLTQEGTIFHPTLPAACGIYYDTDIRLSDIIWRCLFPIAEDKMTVGSFSSVCGTFFGGLNPKGVPYTIVEAHVGGWGAGKGMDGTSAMFSSFHGDTFNCPAEIAEARYGVMVKQLALNNAEGGAGQFRGGKGIDLQYIIPEDNAWLTVGYSRCVVPPWGARGGHDGTPNSCNVLRKNGDIETYHSKSGIILQKGDIIQVCSGNGAGYGDPKSRKHEDIVNDLKNGYITENEAKNIYDYEIQQHNKEILNSVT